jgi:hypothetical protein
MLEEAADKKRVTPEELIRLKEAIEITETNGERQPKDEEQVAENLKFEFKRLKIENKQNSQKGKKGKSKILIF